MAHILRFFHGRHRIQNLLIHKASFFGIGVYREVTHAKRGEVLEEMSALARVDIIVLQCYFHDDPGSTDMRPFDRNSEIMIAGAPTSRSYQHIVLAIGKELAIDAFDVIST